MAGIEVRPAEIEAHEPQIGQLARRFEPLDGVDRSPLLEGQLRFDQLGICAALRLELFVELIGDRGGVCVAALPGA